MKRIFAYIIVIMCVCYASAQTQQGIVKTRGRMVNGQLVAGQRLSGATVTLNFGNPLVSGQNGAFSFSVPSGKSFSLVTAKKQGYTLADPEYTRRSFKYSAGNPFYVVLEDDAQRQADINAATRQVRRTLTAQLQKREDEIEELKAQNKLTEEEYQKRLQELYDNQSKSEQLVKEMAERYAATDYDQLDEFNSQVQMYIEEGELQKADSMIRSKGDMEQRVAEYHNAVATNKKERETLEQRQQALEQSESGAQKAYEDLSQDLKRRSDIFLQEFKQDSALYCLKTRADLDTTNVIAVFEFAELCYSNHTNIYGARYIKDCVKCYHICLRALDNNNIRKVKHIQQNLGVLYRNLEDYVNSEKYLILALSNGEQLFRQDPDAYRGSLGTTQFHLARTYYTIEDYTNSEKYFKLAEENLECMIKIDPDNYILRLRVLYSELSYLYKEVRDKDNFIKYTLKYDDLRLQSIEDIDSQRLWRVSLFSQLGQNCEEFDDDEKALFYYETALEGIILKGTDPTNRNLSYIYDTTGSDKTILDKILEEKISFVYNLQDYVRDVFTKKIRLQEKLACMYRDKKDYAKSEEYFNMCITDYKNSIIFYNNLLIVIENVIENIESNKTLMNTILEAKKKLSSRPFDFSFKLKEESEEEKLARKYREMKDHARRTRIDIDDAYNNKTKLEEELADTYDNLKDYAKSEAYYKLSIEDYEFMTAQNPGIYRFYLAVAQHNLAVNYYNTKDYSECEKFLKLALSNKEILFKENPDKYRSSIALTCRLLGDTYRNLKNYDNSILYYGYAIENYEQLYSQSPDGYKAGCLVIYNFSAYAYAYIGKFDDAITTIDKAIAMEPTNANNYDSKGEILLLQRKEQDALEMWKKVMELNPNFLKDYPNGTELSNGLKKLGLIE